MRNTDSQRFGMDNGREMNICADFELKEGETTGLNFNKEEEGAARIESFGEEKAEEKRDWQIKHEQYLEEVE